VAVLSFAAGIVVARSLPLEDFAVYAIAIAFRGTIQLLADLGTGAASSRAFAQLEQHDARAQAARLFRRLAGVRLLAGAALVVFALLFTDLAGTPSGSASAKASSSPCLSYSEPPRCLRGWATTS
jgi:O-antigen/teichoic acid export membrane protein